MFPVCTPIVAPVQDEVVQGLVQPPHVPPLDHVGSGREELTGRLGVEPQQLVDGVGVAGGEGGDYSGDTASSTNRGSKMSRSLYFKFRNRLLHFEGC